MGWANCGEDSKGRPIGYAFAATCDHPGCLVKIHRGLSYACGGMHGEGEFSCEGYFCEAHLYMTGLDFDTRDDHQLCAACNEQLQKLMRESPESFSEQELEDHLGIDSEEIIERRKKSIEVSSTP